MEKEFRRELFTKNLEVMRKTFRFDYNSMRAIGALLYTLEGRTAEMEKLKECRKILKSEFGVFSYFRGHLEQPIVVKMSMKEDPEAYLRGVNETYKTLSSSFMLGDESRLLAAMILYENIGPDARDEMCEKTMQIYKAMKENHPWLTTQEDLPFAVLIAASEVDVDEKIREVEALYQTVKEKFVFSGNQVQTVSHILSIGKGEAEEKSARFMELRDAFKQNGLRLGSDYMAILAVLANSPLSVEEAVRQSREEEAFLKTQKGFGMLGTGSSIRRVFAAALTAFKNMPDDPTVFGAMSGTILSIILAIELAIMIMIISSTTAASSSGH